MAKLLLKLVAVFILLTSTVTAYSQQSDASIANEAYIKGDFYTALIHYKKAIKRDKDNNEIKIRLANCFYHMNNYVEAQKYYEKANKEDLFISDLVNIAKLLQAVEKYDMAIAMYAKAIKQGAMNPLIETYQMSCKWAMEHDDDEEEYDAQQVTLKLNGAFLGVQYYQDGLVYSTASANSESEKEKGKEQEKLKDKSNDKSKTSENDELHPKADDRGNPFSDLYFAKEIKGELSDNRIFSEKLIFPLHEGSVCFSSDYKTMYFTKNDIVKTSKNYKKENGNKKYLSVMKIYEATFDGKDWKVGKPLTFNSDEYSCLQPTVSPDGNTLYFSSDMPGGNGGRDIYVVKKEGKKWGKPSNLGDKVNSLGDEIFPFIAKTGFLYFSSNGHIGFGGLDIFKSEFVKGRWANVTNMMQKINSSKDDYAYVIDPKDSTEGFFTSNRDGDGDIDFVYITRKFPKKNKLEDQDYTKAEYALPEDVKKVNFKKQYVIYPDKLDSAKIKELGLENGVSNDKKNQTDVVTSEEQYIKEQAEQNKKLKEEGKDSLVVTLNTGKPIKYDRNATVFQVQVYSTAYLIETQTTRFNGLEVDIYHVNGLYKYTSGEFLTKAEAAVELKRVKSLGFSDAFVVSYPYSQRLGNQPEVINESNSQSTTTTAQSNPTGVREIYYSVQFISSEKPIEGMKLMNMQIYRYFYKGAYRYAPNKFFKDQKEAVKLRNQIVGMGYRDAFVATFEKVNGEYIRIDQ